MTDSTIRTVGITGSTGALGGLLTRQLAGSDFRLDLRLLVRDVARAPDIDTDVRVCDYADHQAALEALRGVETLFMVSAAEAPVRREQHRTFIGAAAEAGVRHVVYTSFAGAGPGATFTLGRDHADAEEALRASRMDLTILRNNFYLDIWPSFADDTGTIRGPGGSGRVAAVARKDVADVAAAVLRSPEEHVGRVHTLTGPEALSLAEVARRAGAVLGRDLHYVEETEQEAYDSRRAAYPEAEQYQLDAWVSTYASIADGSCAEVTSTVREVAGHEPRRLEDALT